MNNVAIKLTKMNAMLSKKICYIDIKTIKSIYQTIFDLRLFYALLILVQNSSV